MASVLRGYEVGLLENAQPTERNIFEITDRCSDDVKYSAQNQCPPKASGVRREATEKIFCLLPSAYCLLYFPQSLAYRKSRSMVR